LLRILPPLQIGYGENMQIGHKSPSTPKSGGTIIANPSWKLIET